MKRHWLVVGLLAGCSPSPEEAFSAKVQQAVKSTLRDPYSAQFEKIDLYPNEQTACGKVNAKNGLGGYTGAERFVYEHGKVTHLTDESQDYSEFIAAHKRCMDLGIAQAHAQIKELERR